MKWQAIVIVLMFAYLSRLSEGACQPRFCGPEKNCTDGLVCLGNKCRYCGCNNPSECELGDSGGYKCNCAKSNSGLTGPHCECASHPECEDSYGLQSSCSELSNSTDDVLKIPGVHFVSLQHEGDFSPSDVDFNECFNVCYNFGMSRCRMFMYDQEMRRCKTYRGVLMSPFRSVMKKLQPRETSNVYLLKCLQCMAIESIEM